MQITNQHVGRKVRHKTWTRKQYASIVGIVGRFPDTFIAFDERGGVKSFFVEDDWILLPKEYRIFNWLRRLIDKVALELVKFGLGVRLKGEKDED